MIVSCDWCDREFTVSEILCGRRKACPSCGAPVDIPGAGMDIPAGPAVSHVYATMLTLSIGFLLVLLIFSRWYLARTSAQESMARFRVCCTNCGRTFEQDLTIPPLGNTPVPCHYCLNRTLYQALSCRRCPAVFARTRVGEIGGYTCLHCESRAVGPLPVESRPR